MADDNKEAVVFENEGNRFAVSGSFLGLLLLVGLGFYIQFGRIFNFFREAATALGEAAVEGALWTAIAARDLEPRARQGLFWFLVFFSVCCGVIAFGLTMGWPSVIFLGGAAFLSALFLAMTGVSAAVAVAAKAISTAETALGWAVTALTTALEALKLGKARQGKFQLFSEEVWQYKVRRFRTLICVLWTLAFAPLLVVPNWRFALMLLPVVWGFGILGALIAAHRNWDLAIFWRVAYVGSGIVMAAAAFAYFWPNHAEWVRCKLGAQSEVCIRLEQRDLSDEAYRWAVRTEGFMIKNEARADPRLNGDEPAQAGGQLAPYNADGDGDEDRARAGIPPAIRPDADESAGRPEPAPPGEDEEDINAPPP